MPLPQSCTDLLPSKGRIDKWGERLRESSMATKTLEAIQCFRLFRLLYLRPGLDTVANAQLPDHSVLSVRLKRIPSIQRKIESTRIHLSQMDDVIGLRIICRNYAEAKALSVRMESIPSHKRTKNYICQPKATGYRAAHHIFECIQKFPQNGTVRFSFEVQVRSYYQHMWAIHSESFGERAKAGAADSHTMRELSSLSEEIRKWEGKNQNKIQKEDFPERASTHNLAVVLQREDHDADCYFFRQNYQRAFEQLMYWEMLSTQSRDNTLLLAGMAKADNQRVQAVLKLTHPTFFGIRHPPESWMPTA